MRITSLMALLALGQVPLLAGCTSVPTSPVVRPADVDTVRQLKLLRIELHAAMASGDREKLEELLDESFVFVHSTERVERRPEFIDRMMQAAAQNRVPQLEFSNDGIRLLSGSTAVWVSHSSRAGSPMSFVATDVLVRHGQSWKWVSVQSTRTDR